MNKQQKELVKQLRDLAAYKHDDPTIAARAADEIERLQTRVYELTLERDHIVDSLAMATNARVEADARNLEAVQRFNREYMGDQA